MRATTLKKRLDSIKNLSHNSISYRVINDMLNNNYNKMIFGNLIRPCYVRGRGKHTVNNDYTAGIKAVLDQLAVRYEFGNDSPRGGKTGNYFRIKTKITL